MARNEKAEKAFARVLRYCEKWGINVEMSKEEWDKVYFQRGFFDSEDVFGIAWSSRRIYCLFYENGKLYREIHEQDPLFLLHELSHCLADTNPEDIDEIGSEMLAFEYYSCRYLNLTGRRTFMQHFPLGQSSYWEQSANVWGKLGIREKSKLIKTSLEYAVEVGILDANGKPTFRRVGVV